MHPRRPSGCLGRSRQRLRVREGPLRGERAYALLREAIRESGRIGIAKVILRDAQHLAALVNSLAADWDPRKYTNQYRENLMRIIKGKLTGKPVKQAVRLSAVSYQLSAIRTPAES